MSKRFKKYGWIPDTPDHRDRTYSFSRNPIVELPPSVDLRPGMPECYDQGSLGSCGANSICADIEYAQFKQNVPRWCASRLFIYYNVRVIENTVHEDAGVMLRDVIKACARWGFCQERFWPYDIMKFAKKPPAKVYKLSMKNKITSYSRLRHSIDDLKACLASNDPFFFGFGVYESFESDIVAKTGNMPMPNPNERLLGGHAVLACGYDDEKKVFIIRNSWGNTWGDKGYFYMPYDFINNINFTDDFWTVTYVN